MMARLLNVLSLLTLVWPAAFAAGEQKPGVDLPAVFDKRPYGEAKKAATEGKKWFIVKAAAEWCAPCKRMDNTTWRDEKVVAWLTANAIAVHIDVDEQQQLAGELKIEAMPTVIAIRGADQEFDRIVGYKGPSDTLAWLEGIARGTKYIDAITKLAGDRASSQGKVDIRGGLELARSLQQIGKADQAAEEYAWLWRHMLDHDQAYYGVRLSFMASDMERLASQNQGAKKKFSDLRNETEQAINEEKVAVNDLADWMTLNKIVGEQQRTMAWFDRVAIEASWQPLLERLGPHLEDLLIRERRWVDFGKLYRNPIEKLELAHNIMSRSPKLPAFEGMDQKQQERLEEMPRQIFRTKAGRLYAGLLAAGRDGDAQKLAARARELDDAPAMVAALVSTSLGAGQVRKEQIEWLGAAAKTDSSLRDLLKRAQDALALWKKE